MSNTNYCFISNNVIYYYSNENEATFKEIVSFSLVNAISNQSLSVNTTVLTISNDTTTFILSSPNTDQINSGSYYLNANGSWSVVASNGVAGVTEIQTGNGLSGGPITTTGTLSVNSVYIETLNSNNASYLNGNTATTLRSYSDTTSETAYTNAVSIASSDASSKAVTAYTIR